MLEREWTVDVKPMGGNKAGLISERAVKSGSSCQTDELEQTGTEHKRTLLDEERREERRGEEEAG
jgi:hypothetical protein